ncbi:MAG: PorT family protein [Muribaculaceae bacterium]|nr:PorT family protein [Muribaculaceae bacterium]
MNSFKKIIIALTVILIGAGAANAELRFGVRAGMLINKLSFNQDALKANNSCGWTAGAIVDYTVPIIGISMDAGLMYARMNNATDVTATDVNTTNALIGTDNAIYGKNFLEIPINVKYKFTIPVVGSIVKPYLYTGPNFAFRLDKSITNDVANVKSRACQVAWNVGLGVELIRHLQVSASYGFGINSVVGKVSDINTQELKARNNYWTVSAAWLF